MIAIFRAASNSLESFAIAKGQHKILYAPTVPVDAQSVISLARSVAIRTRK